MSIKTEITPWGKNEVVMGCPANYIIYFLTYVVICRGVCFTVIHQSVHMWLMCISVYIHDIS